MPRFVCFNSFSDRNHLSGKLPTELGNLNGLDSLDLRSNSLTEKIPSELGKLFKLRYLYLGKLSPAKFSRRQVNSYCRPFMFLSITVREACNELTGTIPSELGLVTMGEIGNYFSFES